MDNEQTIEDMPFPWNVVYTAGDRLCHQQASRSLFLNNNQMPFCSRCTAIWIGLALGLLIMIYARISLDGRVVLLFILGLIPIGVDGVGQLFGLWESSNLIRILTGGITGVLCGMGIGVIVDEIALLRSSKKHKSN